ARHGVGYPPWVQRLARWILAGEKHHRVGVGRLAFQPKADAPSARRQRLPGELEVTILARFWLLSDGEIPAGHRLTEYIGPLRPRGDRVGALGSDSQAALARVRPLERDRALREVASQVIPFVEEHGHRPLGDDVGVGRPKFLPVQD